MFGNLLDQSLLWFVWHHPLMLWLSWYQSYHLQLENHSLRLNQGAKSQTKCFDLGLAFFAYDVVKHILFGLWIFHVCVCNVMDRVSVCCLIQIDLIALVFLVNVEFILEWRHYLRTLCLRYAHIYCNFLINSMQRVLGDGLLVLRKIENVTTGPNNRPKLACVIAECGEM